jgi:hypothetical protein
MGYVKTGCVVEMLFVVVDVDGSERKMRDMVCRFVFATGQDANIASRPVETS